MSAAVSDPVMLSQFANVSSNHMIKGRGKTYFKLLNMRHPVVMGFFRGGHDSTIIILCICMHKMKLCSMHTGFESPTLVAISSVLQFSNYNVPLQGHLALTQDPTEML